MSRGSVRHFLCALALGAGALPAWALNTSVPAIHGDVSRSLLGNGTGVVVGIIDSGVDDTHPSLAGLDSQGNPRMVAEDNFVTSENWNSGDDVLGHGTWIASVALSSDATYTGMAPDARFVNARVLDSGASFDNEFQVMNGVGFAVTQGADVLNLSLNFFSANNSGNSRLDLMLDWVAFDQRVSCAVCAGNISNGSGTASVRGPGSVYNGMAVGWTTDDTSRVTSNSSQAFTSNGRMKPDVVAPGTTLTLANSDWEGSAPDWEDNYFGIPLSGCSVATPHLTGLMAQQIEAGRSLGLSTDPLVVKSTIMNSASKVLDKQGNPWEPGTPGSVVTLGGVLSVTQPLDIHSGAGQIDGLTLAEQYLAGEMGPGSVDPIGWDFNSIANSQFIDYTIDANLIGGSSLSATLTWYRHVTRSDNGNGVIDDGDSFSLLHPLSNLNLQILRNGILVAQSISSVDNVEHLRLALDRTAQYTLRVSGANVLGSSEEFALAWYGTPVPEPASLSVSLVATLAALVLRRRARTGRCGRNCLTFNRPIA